MGEEVALTGIGFGISVRCPCSMKTTNLARQIRVPFVPLGRSAPALSAAPMIAAAAGISMLNLLCLDGLAADSDDARATAEMFHVSNVGRPGAAETRELLGAIYREVAGEYNERIEQEAGSKDQSQQFKGERVRILRKITEQHADGKLYLCAYNGSPSVFVVPGEALQGGQLSPPLAGISENGQHTTEITRMVVDPDASKGSEPALQKVDASTGSGVTFFGIPLDTGDSSSSSSSSSSDDDSASGDGGSSGKKQVKEQRTLPFYKAEVSTEPMSEGPPPMSQQLFLSMLKNGEVFSIEQLELRRCQECRGFGRIPDLLRAPGAREADGKIACPECEAVGKIYWTVTYKVGW